MRAVIVDDEALARKGLKLRLERFDSVELIGECANGREALEFIAKETPDLVFLDIQMPGMNGFDVISNLQQDNMPLVVFVTAFDQYAIEAFDVHAVDYLLKPIDDDRLADAIARAERQFAASEAVTEKQRLMDLVISITGKSEAALADMLDGDEVDRKYPEKLAIKDAGEVTLLPIGEIDWVDAAGDYMCVHANDETHVMRITMKELESQLDPTSFQRVHRSTIVNLARVKKVCSHMNGEFHLILENGATVKMSRTYKDKVRHFF